MAPNAPESEQTHAVLPGDDLPGPLLRGQAALARVADVCGEVAQRLLAGQLGDDAFAVVVDGEQGQASMPSAGNPDLRRLGIERVLDELGHRFSRIALASRKPADEIERIRRTQADRVVPTSGHARVS